MTAAMHSLVLLLLRLRLLRLLLLHCLHYQQRSIVPLLPLILLLRLLLILTEQRVLVRTAEQLQVLLPRTGHSVPGGSITVTYTGADDCGNALTGSATIPVTLLRLLLLHCLHYQQRSIVPLLPLILLLLLLLILTEQRVLVRTAEQLQVLLPRTGHSVPGGSITVAYTGTDDCGNALTGSATITVTPAPPATLTLPTLPASLDCAAAAAYTAAPVATYTNEQRVLVRTAEQLQLLLPPGLCAGGSITVAYTGIDDCGNALTGSATIPVTLLRLLLLHCLHYQQHSIVPLLPLILQLRLLLY